MEFSSSRVIYLAAWLLAVLAVATCKLGPKDPKHWKGGLEGGQTQNLAVCAQECSGAPNDPVCGTDNKTYPNKCWAECSGVDMYFPGQCTEWYLTKRSAEGARNVARRRIFWKQMAARRAAAQH